MNMELISVILPVWKPNVSHLEQCIDSLIDQTYADIEIIISYKKSDQSNDEFYDLINKYKDDRIKVIESKIKGIANQRNDGIRNSKGKFIAAIDADDFFEPRKFERQLEFKKENKCNILGTWGHYVTSEGKGLYNITRPVNHNEIRKKIMLRGPLLHSSVIMDRKMLKEIGLYNTSFTYAVDYELWFRAMSKGYKFGNVPEYLVNIRYEPTSSTRSNWKMQRIFIMKARSKAVFRYGFFKPLDILYYLPSLFYYFISPNLAITTRKKINTISSNIKKQETIDQ